MKLIRRRITALGAALTLLSPLFAASPAMAECCSCRDSATNKFLCITTSKGTCSTINADYSSNPGMSTVTCTDKVADEQCKTVVEHGLCRSVSDAQIYNGKAEADGSGNIQELVGPDLQVKIPGLSFTTDPSAQGGDLQISFLAQYVSAAYKYLVGVSIIAAAIMIVYGGVLYIIGSSATSISSGKEIIGNAIMGLFLVIGTFTILNTINTAITNPKALSVRLVNRQDASADAETDAKRVAESAVAKPSSRAESSIVDVSSPNLGTPEGETPHSSVSPGTQPAAGQPTAGTTATNSKGEYVAQGSCPDGMLPIPYSSAYEEAAPKKASGFAPHVNSFCMDVFEAPGIQGQKPYIVNDWEADWYCRDHGKRLCTTSEWVRACMGPKAENLFGYGPTFIPGKWVNAKKPNDDPQWYALKRGGSEPGPCNYDTPPLGSPNWGKLAGYGSYTPEESILNLNNPKLANPKVKAKFDAAIAQINRLNGSEPSGSRAGCVTAEGIHDMTGNVAEVTVKDRFSTMTTDQRVALGPKVVSGAKPYDWRGFYWAPRPHKEGQGDEPNCRFSAGGPHNAGSGWRDYANGFRCCLDLATGQ